MSLPSLRRLAVGLACFVALSLVANVARSADPLRAPCYPLISCDPYFSVWSNTDELADSFPVHWTGRIQALVSLARVDGANFRLMGSIPQLAEKAPKMTQTDVSVRATDTTYRFADAGVEITLTFTNPNLPDDLEALSRPATYLTWSVRSTDGADHDVAFYFDASAELCVNNPDQRVIAKRQDSDLLDVMRVGTAEQPVLGKTGDDLRIDWGYFYVAAEKGAAQTAIASDMSARGSFLENGALPTEDDKNFPRAAQDDWPVLAVAFNCGKVGADAVEKKVIVAYDDVYCLEYLGDRLESYWRRNGMSAIGMLETSFEQYDALRQRCAEFDQKIWDSAAAVGGEKYAFLCSLAYPQVIAANKLTTLPNGKLIFVSKENFSNGCVATVDLLYPASPLFIALDSTLLKATVTTDLEYAASERWNFPFAPHDLGQYPKMNGQVYGGGEKTEENQMPVEESANIIIVVDAIARLDGNVDYAKEYWPLLEQWTEYLVEKGFDSETQLCTDDFAGRLARNANLSIKAIVAIACFADLCDRAGDKDAAAKYRAKAEEFVKEWQKLADAGDHYSLVFEKPETWSQKYNLVWDKLFGLGLFPEEVAQKEIAYYKTKLNKYGLPLDSRAVFTKTDWQVWTATLANDRADFDELMEPVYRFLCDTTPRVPITDWYMTDTAKECNMQARSVLGAVFIKQLENKLNDK